MSQETKVSLDMLPLADLRRRLDSLKEEMLKLHTLLLPEIARMESDEDRHGFDYGKRIAELSTSEQVSDEVRSLCIKYEQLKSEREHIKELIARKQELESVANPQVENPQEDEARVSETEHPHHYDSLRKILQDVGLVDSFEFIGTPGHEQEKNAVLKYVQEAKELLKNAIFAIATSEEAESISSEVLMTVQLEDPDLKSVVQRISPEGYEDIFPLWEKVDSFVKSK
jgi:hypothetical protein